MSEQIEQEMTDEELWTFTFGGTVGDWMQSLPGWKQVIFNFFSAISGGRMDFPMFRLLGYHRWSRKQQKLLDKKYKLGEFAE